MPRNFFNEMKYEMANIKAEELLESGRWDKRQVYLAGQVRMYERIMGIMRDIEQRVEVEDRRIII